MRVNLLENPLMHTDVYKWGHLEQYKPNTEYIYSYLEARKPNKTTVFYGLQYYLKQYLANPITHENVDEVLWYMEHILMSKPSSDVVKKLRSLADLGYFPIEIKAPLEGTVLSSQNAILTIKSTLPNFHWVVGYLESLLLKLWNTISVASSSLEYRQMVEKYSDLTCDNRDHIPYAVHDFGYRGVSSEETAMLSGSAHLLTFLGTDTIPAVKMLRNIYGCEGLIGCSINATEHSVCCSYGLDGEFDYFKRMVTELYPNGMVSIVSDTYDYYNVLTNFLPRLKDDIMAREGKIVLRPDCYDEKTEVLTTKGWKLFKDLDKENDLVAQFNEDKSIEFVKPLKYYEADYDGKMYSFKNFTRSVDLLVTPNHRMIKTYKGKVEVREADKIPLSKGYFLNGGDLKGSVSTLTCLDRFKIAFQADGCFLGGGIVNTKGNYLVVFALTKKRKVDRLTQILEDCGFEYTTSIYENRPERTSFFIHVPAYAELSKLFDWVDLSDKSGDWCSEFVAEAECWDGYIQNDNLSEYCTRVEYNSSIMQTIATLAGYRTVVAERVDNRSEKFSNIFRVSINKKGYTSTQSITRNIVDYSGKVYCVQVPSGMLLVKRNNTIVVSGNSGDQKKILLGDESAEPNSAENKGTFQILWDLFGGTVNNKGYKILDSHVGVVFGDGFTKKRFEEVLSAMEKNGFATSNLVIGVGGLLLQQHNRDDLGFALKATKAITTDGEEVSLFKDPKTDSKKKSKTGYMKLVKEDDSFNTLDNVSVEEELSGELQTVFRNGEILRTQTLDDIRLELSKYLG